MTARHLPYPHDRNSPNTTCPACRDEQESALTMTERETVIYRCSNCRKLVEQEWNFCAWCGASRDFEYELVRTDGKRGDKETLEAAQAALVRMDARKGEDVDEWAANLADDLAKFKD